MTKKEIADILKNIRVCAGYTQKEVSEKINRPQQTIASWESGKSQPDANTLFELCDLYGVSVDDAFGYTQKYSSLKVTKEEYEMIEKYRSLDLRGQETVNRSIDEQARYIAAQAEESENTTASSALAADIKATADFVTKANTVINQPCHSEKK